MRIEEVATVTPELVDAFARLVPQLSRSSPPPDAAALQAIVDAAAPHLLVAVLGLAPLGRTSSCVGTSTTPDVCTSSSESLVDHEGAGVLVVLAVPVVVAAIGAARPARRVLIGIAILLSVGVVVAGFSIGF